MNDDTGGDARDWYLSRTATSGGRLADARRIVRLSRTEPAVRFGVTGERERRLEQTAIETGNAPLLATLTAMRQVQRDIVRCGDELGHLEKRLRLAQKAA